MIFLIIAVILFVTDFVLKKYMDQKLQYGMEEEILEGNIILNKVHNHGAIFGFLQEQKEILRFLSLMAAGFIVLLFTITLPRNRKYLTKIGLALILGGGANNLYERLTKGYVVDYFSFKQLKRLVFNLSDIFVFLGTALCIISDLIKKNKG